MLIKTCGIIVRVQKVSSGGKLLWILTKDEGIIRAFCKEPGRKTGGFVATEFLSLSDFVLFKSRSGFTINSAEIKEPFANICKDVEKLAVASYFCEAMIFAVPQQCAHFASVLKLLYLVLLALNNGADVLETKVIFELKFAMLLGFLPKLSSEEITGPGLFCVKTGSLNEGLELYSIKVTAKMAKALKTIVCLQIKKIFMLEISKSDWKRLAVISEAYLLDKLETRFSTLDYFWNFKKTNLKLSKVGGRA